jgi:hypothetical protein
MILLHPHGIKKFVAKRLFRHKHIIFLKHAYSQFCLGVGRLQLQSTLEVLEQCVHFMLGFLDHKIIFHPLKEGGWNLIFELQCYVRLTCHRLESPRDRAVEPLIAFDNEALIRRVFDGFAFAFEGQTRHLVSPVKVKAVAVLRFLDVLDLNDVGPDLRQVVRVSKKFEDSFDWGIDPYIAYDRLRIHHELLSHF